MQCSWLESKAGDKHARPRPMLVYAWPCAASASGRSVCTRELGTNARRKIADALSAQHLSVAYSNTVRTCMQQNRYLCKPHGFASHPSSARHTQHLCTCMISRQYDWKARRQHRNVSPALDQRDAPLIRSSSTAKQADGWTSGHSTHSGTLTGAAVLDFISFAPKVEFLGLCGGVGSSCCLAKREFCSWS